MPPLKIYSNGIIDLEFGPLLVVDYLVMDSAAFDRMQMDKTPVMMRVRESLRELRNEGFLRLVDYTSILNRNREWILESSREQASDPLRWSKALQLAVTGWEGARDQFRQVVDASHYDMAMHIPFGIYAYLSDSGTDITEDNYQRARRLIFSERERVPRPDREVLSMCLRPYLDHVFSCMAVRNELQLPLADWENLRPLYLRLYRQFGPTKPPADQIQDKVRELFACAIPTYEPESVKQLLKLLKDKRIEVLRAFVRVAVKEGHQFSHNDVERVLREIHAVNVRKGRIGSGLNITGFVVGASLTVTGIGAVPGIIAAAAASGIQEVAQRTASDYLDRDLSWLYLLMENK